MTRLIRRLVPYRGRRRAGTLRPLPAWPPPSDPWALSAETILLPVVYPKNGATKR